MKNLPIGLKGYFIDKRDGRLYHTVVMPDGKEWMAENLAYNSGDGCFAYDNEPANVDKYGRLYTWDAAVKACPAGWRLPNDNDWDALFSAVGSSAGSKLKSQTGWNTGSGYIPGTDEFSFSALPGGGRWSDGDFNNVGNYGFWWSATEDGAGYAHSRDMIYNFEIVYSLWYGKSHGLSVRCLREAEQQNENS